jgi:hypothetical protein
MESTSARDLDRRLADLVRSERHLVVQFVLELAAFAKRELYRELGYTSLFYYCVRQLGLSKSSAFRRSEVARLVARFPGIADRLAAGRLSIRALVELREVLIEENQVEVLARAEGMSQEEAQLLAVEYKPRPIPRDVVRALPMPRAQPATSPMVPVETNTHPPAASPAVPAAAETKTRAPPETPGENDRYVPAAVKRAVWERDQRRCTWPMGDGKVCGSTHRLEFDHDLEVALGGKPVTGDIRLLCKGHNLMKAEQHLGRALMARFRKDGPLRRDPSSS